MAKIHFVIVSLLLILMTNESEQFLSNLLKFLDKPCDKGHWCSGSIVEDCKTPLTNPTTCCFFCPKNGW